MQTLDEKLDDLKNSLISSTKNRNFREISADDLEKLAFDAGTSVETAGKFIRSLGIEISETLIIAKKPVSFSPLSRCQKEEFCILYLKNKNSEEISDELRIDLDLARNYYKILDDNYLILQSMFEQKVNFFNVVKNVPLENYIIQKIWGNFRLKEESAALSKMIA